MRQRNLGASHLLDICEDPINGHDQPMIHSRALAKFRIRTTEQHPAKISLLAQDPRPGISRLVKIV